jgi:hypothetical protein
MPTPHLTIPAVSVLHLNKWMTEHDELPRCVDVHAAKAAVLADFDWLTTNHNVVYVSEALDTDRFREHWFDPPVLARIVKGSAEDGLVSLVGLEVELFVNVTIEGREGQFLVRLGRRRAYDVSDGMRLDGWREVVRHPSREAAEAAADADARALVGREAYVTTVDVPEGTVAFDRPARVLVTNVDARPTNDGQWNYFDLYVDFVFRDVEDAERAPGAWTYGRPHAYPRMPSTCP